MSAVTTTHPIQRASFHIPSLDGMRAIAVLLVFSTHAHTIPGFFSGHVGVTIFFFLSGYLITTLLRREQERSGTISLGRFYMRRVLRILPPAWLAILAAVAIGATGLLNATTSGWGVLAETLNYTNYYIVIHGRDGLPSESTMLWSLAVEEHYYLVFPVLLLVLFRIQVALRSIGVLLLVMAALICAWRIVLGFDGAGFDRLYVSTDTRIDSLLIGSAMALLLNPVYGDTLPVPGWFRPWLRYATPLSVALFVGTALFAETPALRLTVVDTIQCLSLVAIFHTIILNPQSRGGRLLNHPWAVRIGVLSFSIYLFHRMVIALVDQVIGFNPLMNIVALGATVVIAQVVYLVIERPCGRLRKRLEAGSVRHRPGERQTGKVLTQPGSSGD